MSAPPKVHLDRDGRARCGRPPGVQVAADAGAVTCDMCLAIMLGTHGAGNRQPDNDDCGTPARYKWHLRHQGKPVRCRRCLQAEQRRVQHSSSRDAYNAGRRKRYAEARAAGLSAAEANRRSTLRRAA